VLEWIKVKTGYTQIGSVATEPTIATLQSLLYLTPTAKVPDHGYPPFPISNLPLFEWMNLDPEEIPASPITNSRVVVEEFHRDIKDFSEAPVPLGDDALKKAVSTGTASNEAAQESIRGVTTAISSSSFLDGVIPSETFIPEFNATDLAYVYGNTSTKVDISIALAKAELDGWEMLSGTCADQMQDWSIKLTALRHLQAKLKECKAGGQQMMKMLRETGNELDGMQSEIDQLKTTNPVAAKMVQRALQNPSSQSQSSHQSSYYSDHRSPPYEPRFQDQMNDPKETDEGFARTNSAPPSTGFPTLNSGNNANSIGGGSIK
jgi:hypothetical protein